MKNNKQLNTEFVQTNLMGPNAIKMLEELLQDIEIKPNMRILDLGCGTALTSIFTALNYDVEIFAVDLWISANDNYERVKEYNLEDRIIPLNCDANELGFPDNYFDMIMSIDSYHYFGNNNEYLNKIESLLKDNGKFILGIPGVKSDEDDIFNRFSEFIPKEAFNIYSMNWWLNTFKNNKNMKITLNKELDCYDSAWQDWLDTDNEYAIGDRPMIAKVGNLMNLLGFIMVKTTK